MESGTAALEEQALSSSIDVQIPFSERPYATSCLGIFNEDDLKVEVNRFKFFKEFFTFKQCAQGMPGYYKCYLLEELKNVADKSTAGSDDDGNDDDDAEEESTITTGAPFSTKRTTISSNTCSRRRRPTTKQYTFFSLWDSQQNQGNSFQTQHSFDALERMGALLKEFPKFNFWVQVSGTHLEKETNRRRRRTSLSLLRTHQGQQEHDNNASMVEMNINGTSSTSAESSQSQSFTTTNDRNGNSVLSDTDIVVITKWSVRGPNEMTPFFQHLQTLKQYACHELVLPPAAIARAKLLINDKQREQREGVVEDYSNNGLANPLVEETNNDDTERVAETPTHTCHVYEIYLTYNHDTPYEYMEITIWPSLQAYDRFFKDPYVTYTYDLLKTNYCKCHSNEGAPIISYWKNINETHCSL